MTYTIFTDPGYNGEPNRYTVGWLEQDNDHPFLSKFHPIQLFRGNQAEAIAFRNAMEVDAEDFVKTYWTPLS